MDQQGEEPAARSFRKGCKQQALGRVVSGRETAETGVHQTLLFRKASKRKLGMLLEHMR